MSATVKIRLVDFAKSATSKSPSFAVADLFPVRTTNARTESVPRRHNFGIDLKTGEQTPKSAGVEPGKYSVRVKFSSGDVLTQTVSISTDEKLKFEVETGLKPISKSKSVRSKEFHLGER